MPVRPAQRRASDAPDPNRQGNLLDNQRRVDNTKDRPLPHNVVWAEARLVAGTEKPLRFGALVNVGGGADGFVQRAGVSNRAADGIVIVGGDGAVQWTRRAILWLPLDTPTTSGPKTLYLSSQGRCTLTEPTTGPVQIVGVALRRSTARGLWECLVEPGGAGMQQPANWPREHVWYEVPTETVDGVQTNFSTTNTYLTGTLRVWMDRVLQIPGTDFTEDADKQGYTFTVAPPDEGGLASEVFHAYEYVL